MPTRRATRRQTFSAAFRRGYVFEQNNKKTIQTEHAELFGELFGQLFGQLFGVLFGGEILSFGELFGQLFGKLFGQFFGQLFGVSGVFFGGEISRFGELFGELCGELFGQVSEFSGKSLPGSPPASLLGTPRAAGHVATSAAGNPGGELSTFGEFSGEFLGKFFGELFGGIR